MEKVPIMLNQLSPSQELHEFPLPAELSSIDSIHLLAKQARSRFAGETILTRLEESEVLSYGTNRVLVLRADELPGHCFKYLSAMNSVADLVENGHREFTFATAGSYGIGVGHAINTYGGEATAFVPVGASPAKQSTMRELGVTVEEYGSNVDEALEHASRYAEQQQVKLLHPYASLANLGGTGILGEDIAKKCPDVTDLVLQLGGGSLAGGVAPVVKKYRPGSRITVVQAEGCSPFVDSMRSGEVQESKDVWRRGGSYFSRLGGVGVGRTDPLTLGVVSRVVDAVGTVRIDHVYATMYDYEQAHGVQPEFAAAVGLSAARDLARTRGVEEATIVAVFTGANPDTYRPNYLERMSSRRHEEEASKTR
jgi:threonine dehydratase